MPILKYEFAVYHCINIIISNTYNLLLFYYFFIFIYFCAGSNRYPDHRHDGVNITDDYANNRQPKS